MKHLHCVLYGHNFSISKHVTHHVKEYTCKHCQQQATTSSNGTMILLNEKRKEINETLAKVHQSKNRKKLAFNQ